MTTLTDDRHLRSYLQHHWVGSKGGLELFQRAARSQLDAGTRERLAEIVGQVEKERRALREIADRFGVGRATVWQSLATAGERLGRLKPNGTLVRRSPLSDVVELEALELGVRGKLQGWWLLRELAGRDDRLDTARLDGLVELAEQQLATLEELRRAAAHRMVS